MRKKTVEAQLLQTKNELDETRAHPFMPFVDEAIMDLGILAVSSGELKPEEEQAVIASTTALAVFNALPDEIRWQKLIELYDDEIIKKALEKRRFAAMKRAQLEIDHGDMFEEAMYEARLDTRKLIEGDKVSVGLFHHRSDLHLRTLEESTNPININSFKNRLEGRLDVIALGEALFRVTDIRITTTSMGEYDERHKLLRKINLNSVIGLGTVLNSGKKEFDQVIYQDAPLGIARGDKLFDFNTSYTNFVTGFVLVNGEEVFSHPSAPEI